MRCLHFALIALAMLIALVPCSRADAPLVGTLFVTDGTFLYTLDSLGNATQIGQLGSAIFNITWQNGTLYGLATNSYLYTIDPGTATCKLVGDTGITVQQGFLSFGLTSYNGQLYTQVINYLTPGSSALYSINPNTGAAMATGSLGLSTYVYALASAGNGTFYGSEADNLPTSSFYTMGSAGSPSSVTQLSNGFYGMDFDPSGNLFGIHGDGIGDTATVYQISISSGTITPVFDAQVYGFGIAFVK
jgi:hypothetical protein